MRNRDYTVVAMLLARLKNNLRITSTDLDEDLTQKVLAASSWAERFIGRVIVPSSFESSHKIDASSILSLRLHGPLLSPVAVEGDAAFNVEVSGLDVTVKGEPGTEVKVSYKAGLEQIPDDMLHAILIKASYLFDNPTDSVEERNTASMNLLRSYRSYSRR